MIFTTTVLAMLAMLTSWARLARTVRALQPGPCRDCDGHGRVRSTTCATCFGTGSRPRPALDPRRIPSKLDLRGVYLWGQCPMHGMRGCGKNGRHLDVHFASCPHGKHSNSMVSLEWG